MSTTPAFDAEFVRRLLTVTAFENTDDLWWRHGTGEADDPNPDALAFFVNCNDVFHWGCADLEQVTPDSISTFEQAYADAQAATGDTLASGALLYCARQRQMRPQGAMYKHLDVRLHPLFDACGPRRDTGFGNPQEQP